MTDSTQDDSTDHIDWDILAEERLGQRPKSEHGRHIPQTSPAPGCDSGSYPALAALRRPIDPVEAVAWRVEWREGDGPVCQFYADEATARRVEGNVRKYKVDDCEPFSVTPLYASHPTPQAETRREPTEAMIEAAYARYSAETLVTSDDWMADVLRAALSTSPAPAEDETKGQAILKHCDELHDLGFRGGWDGAIDECAKTAKAMREKHGSPTGDAYSNGVWDQGVRIEQAIRSLTSPDPKQAMQDGGGK